MELSIIIAKSCIKDLVVRERYYRDTCQWDKFRHCYHPDTRETKIDISWYHGGVDGFVEGSKEMAAQGASALHTITPVEVEVTDDKAVSISVGSIVTRFFKQGGGDGGKTEYELTSTCRFVSRLKNVACSADGQLQDWKMLSMECVYVYDAVSPVAPFDNIFDSISLPHSTRTSYRYLSLLLAEKGRPVNSRLAGVDEPQSVEHILERNRNWLLGNS